ncbi:heme-binding peroxidase [Penicillium angulare]|uniref:Heme-binding peroxidase n=1 Tax=Penicillium angulare TaxID=116970 RepID=A0A9W9GDF1_9EURO|nr:heme-binding peroxidase [Penicillium angulare]
MTEDDLLVKLRQAIQEPHASIHRLNLSRIALCIPPQIHQPILYALGLSRYAEIFYGMEEVWVAVIGDPADWIDRATDDRIADSESPPSSSDSTERITSLLRLLYVPELLRTRALQADLSFLGAMDPNITRWFQTQNPGAEIREYLNHEVRGKPHLLVAWIWIIYSAILYGGYEIQAKLLKAGAEFWDLSEKELKSSRTPCPLSFWHIDGAATVKKKFRTLMVDANRLLTRSEQQEVIDESLRIFKKLERLTLSLDEEAKTALL